MPLLHSWLQCKLCVSYLQIKTRGARPEGDQAASGECVSLVPLTKLLAMLLHMSPYASHDRLQRLAQVPIL